MADAAVVLFWGEDEFLLRQAAHELLATRGIHPAEVDARAWRGGETSDLATPSLWGEERALLVTGCQALSEAGASELRAYIEAPSTEALCILTLVSGAKGQPPLARIVRASGGMISQIAVKRQDLPRWVMDRANAKGVQMSGPAAVALVGRIGEDTAALEQAVEQLAGAFAGRQVGAEEIRAQFVGLGEQRVWDLCDQAFTGRLSEALITLRALLEARDDPLLILGGIGSRVRDLIRVRSLPARTPQAEAAKAAGLRFDWQLRRYREQARRFRTAGDLVDLHELVMEADRQVKGGVPGDVAMPCLVVAMAGERGAALRIPIRVSR